MIGVVKQTTAGATTKGPLQSSTKAPPQTTVRPAGTASTQQAALLAQHQQAILKASQSLANSQTHTLQPKQAQQAAPPRPPSEPEPEPFELPEVDSEYSDSDEEEQAKKAALRPGWTHSPELRQALAMQASFNPDELFGAIPQLHMEGESGWPLRCAIHRNAIIIGQRLTFSGHVVSVSASHQKCSSSREWQLDFGIGRVQPTGAGSTLFSATRKKSMRGGWDSGSQNPRPALATKDARSYLSFCSVFPDCCNRSQSVVVNHRSEFFPFRFNIVVSFP